MNKIQGNTVSPKVKKFVLISLSIVAFCAILAVAIQLFGLFKAENNSIVVYKKGIETVVRIDECEKSISDITATDFKCDKESGRVFYLVESSFSDGLYDLYFIEKNRSDITEPKIIDIGLSSQYEIVSGNVYYLKKNVSAGAYEGCVCDIDNNKIETFSGNVNSIYPLSSNSVYFTKMHGNNLVLYKYNGIETTEICRDLKNIILYNKTENPRVIYEKKSSLNSGMTELFVAYSESEPELICDNTYYIMYDEYMPDGNLYYFTSSSESVSWSYVIADQYAESDVNITKPQRTDFFAFLGISAEYNAAYKEYQHKLIRDEIRTALNESVSNGEFSVPVYNAFAFNENGSFLIAENIDPKNVYAVSSFGAPKIIFESTKVLPSDTDMNTLVEIAQRSEMREVISYAMSIVEESVKSEGMAYAAYAENGSVLELIDEYDKNNTLFSFSSNGEMLFAFIRESQGERLNLYSNSISETLALGSSVGVDTGISSYSFSDDSVIYLKSDRNKNSGDIFNYNGSQSVKLSNSADAFMVEGDENVIILKNHNSSSSKQTADYYMYCNEKETLINSGVFVDEFICSDNGIVSYITAENKLYVYDGKESALINDDVTDIFLFE